ncbi:hypothetical protein GW17_00022959 [Ensete ventricosum]|nr:hypothetical protein GW17_00022959 [Ensete ventricosum]
MARTTQMSRTADTHWRVGREERAVAVADSRRSPTRLERGNRRGAVCEGGRRNRKWSCRRLRPTSSAPIKLPSQTAGPGKKAECTGKLHAHTSPTPIELESETMCSTPPSL